MSTMHRVEEWQIEFEGYEQPTGEVDDDGEPVTVRPPAMINTLVMSVWVGEEITGEVVRIQQEMVPEFGLDTSLAAEVVPEFHQRFVWEFPYDVVKSALEERGWTRAGTP